MQIADTPAFDQRWYRKSIFCGLRHVLPDLPIHFCVQNVIKKGQCVTGQNNISQIKKFV